MGEQEPISESDFQQELLNKEALIEALTTQLESTVEELDRVRRSGNAGSNSGGGRDAGFGPRVTAQIKEAVADFEEVSVLEHFERLEIGVEQILELLSGEASVIENLGARASSYIENNDDDEADRHVETQESQTEPRVAYDDSEEGDFWARTKARLMAEEENNSSNESSSVETNTQQREESNVQKTQNIEPAAPTVAIDVADLSKQENQQNVSVNTGTVIPPAPPSLPDLPRPVERLDDPDEMEKAISERDGFISYLITRIRKAEMRPFEPIDWEKMSNVPADLEKSLMILQHHLVQHVSQAELSISLDRAALTRERAKLRQIKDKLMSEIQHLGNSASNATSYRDRMEERLNKMLE